MTQTAGLQKPRTTLPQGMEQLRAGRNFFELVRRGLLARVEPAQQQSEQVDEGPPQPADLNGDEALAPAPLVPLMPRGMVAAAGTGIAALAARPTLAGGLEKIRRRADAGAQQPSHRVPADRPAGDLPQEGGARAGLRLGSLAGLGAPMQEVHDDMDEDGPGETDDGEPFSGEAAAPLVEYSGVLNSVRVFGDWAIGTLWTADREEIRLTGAVLSGLVEGLEYRFSGRIKDSAKHGQALDVAAYEPVISVDVEALERYMVKTFNGVGPAKAAKFIRGIVDDARHAAQELAQQGGLVGAAGESADVEAAGAAAANDALVELREKLLHRPWEIDLTALASKAKLEAGHDPQEAAKQVVVARNLMLRLGAQKGFRENVAKSLAAYLVDEIRDENSAAGDGENPGLLGVDLVAQSWAKLVTNPYKPIRHAPGYGFGMAEIIASFVGIPKDAGMRLAALSEYAVEQECQRKGHVFLVAKDFLAAVRRVDPTVDAQKALTFALEQKLLVAEIESRRLYAPKLFDAEKGVARNLARLMAPAQALTSRSAEEIRRKLHKDASKINASFEGGLDEAQIEAVVSILTSPSRLHVLTGGPGTGKTAIVECMVYLLKRKSFSFAAPTGKAAKVLSSRVASMGYSASTIHSLLRGGPEDGFQVNEESPLDCDVLVVDESTMNGIELANGLLNAVGENTHVIFIGDPGSAATAHERARAGQLPSIAPGRFMRDLLELPDVNHVNLSRTYRNSGGILEVVNEIRDGVLDVRDRPNVRFHGLPAAGVGFAAVQAQFVEYVIKVGIENTLLIMPKRQGDRAVADWNTTYANAMLRSVVNPQGVRLPGSTLAVGDRIIIRQNLSIEQPDSTEKAVLRMGASLTMPGAALPLGFNRDLLVGDTPVSASVVEDDDDDVFRVNDAASGDGRTERVVNGDTGTIIGYSMDPRVPRVGSPKWIHLLLDDGRKLDFPGDDSACLDLAYALTVHAGQGSEYRSVMMVVTPGTPDFMNQNMVFTGFSRGRSDLVIYGDPSVLKKIAATPMPERNSALVERVNEEMRLADSPADVCADQFSR